MQWLNEPPIWKAEGKSLTATTAPRTDFWRKTHYGFIRDSGHFCYREATGDFRATVKISGDYRDQYDQAGLMVRVDEHTWLKCGIEFVDGVQHASAVVTRDFSDWSVIPLPNNPPAIWLRVTRSGDSFEVSYGLDGNTFTLLRLAYLTEAAAVAIGPMCASPDGDGLRVTFDDFEVISQ